MVIAHKASFSCKYTIEHPGFQGRLPVYSRVNNIKWHSRLLEDEIANFLLKLNGGNAKRTRKLGNFNIQWVKTLYQNSITISHSFLHFSRAIDVISYL